MRKKKVTGSDGKFASSHYGGADNPYEAIKVIEAWGYDKDFLIGTALRYICRQGKKSGNPPIQDLEKALWYLTRKIINLKKMSDGRRRGSKKLVDGRRRNRPQTKEEKKLERSLKAAGVLRRTTRLHMGDKLK